MASLMSYTLSALTILQLLLSVGDQNDAAILEPLQGHKQQESWDATWLLKELEERSQQPSILAPEHILLTACQYWWLWVSAEVLLILFGVYWLRRRRSAVSDSCNQVISDIPDHLDPKPSIKFY